MPNEIQRWKPPAGGGGGGSGGKPPPRQLDPEVDDGWPPMSTLLASTLTNFGKSIHFHSSSILDDEPFDVTYVGKDNVLTFHGKTPEIALRKLALTLRGLLAVKMLPR